jgi:hypothetical protein
MFWQSIQAHRSCFRRICFALPSCPVAQISLPSPRLISHSSHSFRLLPRPSGITSSETTDAFYYDYMADQKLRGTVGDERVNRRQVGEKRKEANWFESVVAGAAMLVAGIVGVVAVFDWYFFSVVDGISISLEPIVSAFNQANVNASKKPENAPHRVERSATIERLREDFTIPSEEQSSRARSLIVPMRSAANDVEANSR